MNRFFRFLKIYLFTLVISVTLEVALNGYGFSSEVIVQKLFFSLVFSVVWLLLERFNIIKSRF
ncbi:MAG: hypothetical protein AAF616_14460 [Bacteroidota bacterium]